MQALEKQTTDQDKDIDYSFLGRDYKEDLAAHNDATTEFDAFEAMNMAKTYDQVSGETKNGLTDSATATIYLERAARVAGKLPDGETLAFGNKDVGKGLFMDILRTKWIYPNANAQRPFKTKMYMWQYGSSMYGYMPMYVDLNISPTGYFGPDCWLWNPRKFIPQNGFYTTSDMDYCHALADKSKTWFEDLLEEDDDGGWNKDSIKDVIEQIKNHTSTPDANQDTLLTRKKQTQPSRKIVVATRYESGEDGHWITFLPDYSDLVIRDIPNPHKNGKIPFVIKPCIPTFDSFYGVSDFQRSMPMQFANDGLDNFYFQGIKINLFPPTIINSQGVVRHTIKPGKAGSVWEEIIPNSIRKFDGASNAGLSTYSSAKGMAKGAIQSIAGTTDTRSNSENSMDPGMGKTPKALSMISEREDTRDAQDRDHLELAMQELVDIMMDLILIIPNKVPVSLFSEEIEEIISSGHSDLAEIFKVTSSTGLLKYKLSDSKNQMRLTIDPTKLRGLTYRFELKAGSTAKETKKQQLEAMVDYLNFMGKMPNALQEYREATGKTIDWEYFSAEYGKLAGVKNMDKMFTDAATPQAQPIQQPAETPQPAVPQAPVEVAPVGQQIDPTMQPQPVQEPQMAPGQPHPIIQEAMARANELLV